jgi:hypothetical protein
MRVLDGAFRHMVAIWICLCALLSCAGWLLSGLHALNRFGYLCIFVAIAAAVAVWKRRSGYKLSARISISKLCQRFRRPFPLAFAILAALAILGGMLHPPSNYDGLTYRTPRVLHWLAAEQWHWVQSDFPRLNVRAAAYEWVTTPLIAFTRTDRFNFLINAVSFLLLPGLVFRILHRLGVHRRVAWRWMWLFPTGYTYLLQAGSIGNDLFGATFAFAAIHFALRAPVSGRVEDVWLSLLAAALATGAKSSNLLIGLPWLVAILPTLKLIRKKLASSFFVGLAALTVSFIPNAMLNIRYCGDWSGQVLERGAFGGFPLFRLVANGIGFILQNLVPPIFPLANRWNEWVKTAMPSGLAARMTERFEPSAAGFQLSEMQTEEVAGLGFGVCALFLITLVAVRLSRSNCRQISRGLKPSQWLVGIAAWVAVGIFMTQSGLSGAVRYLACFNVLLIAPFLVANGNLRVVNAAWWRWLCGVVFVLAGLLLIVNPARPLWPAVTILRAAGAEQSSNHLVQRAWKVYSVYSRRAFAFQPACAMLPPDASPLGFLSFDDPETSLWRPFGSRRILHIRSVETSTDLRRRGIKYVLASSETLQQNWNKPLDEWLAQVNGEIVSRVHLHLRASTGPKEWYLIRIQEGPTQSLNL